MKTGSMKVFIIDDDFLLSQYPTSINWNLDLLGKNSTNNQTAYKELKKKLLNLVNCVKKLD